MTTDELKKEAEESLDKRLGTYAYIRKQDCYTNYVDGYIDSAEPREKRIAELEQENAELKGLVNQYKASKCGSISLVNRNMIMFDQLTKAKELIKTLLLIADNRVSQMEFQLCVADAKQLLSEVEK
jgi:hypothetical protein